MGCARHSILESAVLLPILETHSAIMFQASALAIGALLSAVAVLAPRTAPVALNPCYGSDSYAVAQVRYLRGLTSSAKSLEVSYRTRVQLPAVQDTSEIYLVSDSTTCLSALTTHNATIGYNSAELQTSAAQQVYLIRVKDVFVASNPHVRTGGTWVPQVVMNDQFQMLTTFMH